MKKLSILVLAAGLFCLSSCEKTNDVNGPNVRPANGTENGYAWVDLGLSVKWATCNVGAMTPDGSGDYFGWGEVQPRSYYGWGDYMYSDYDVKMTKYCTNSSYGKVDNKTILELTDDAAYVNWAGNWRMPTYEEFDELKNNCTWTWTTQDGIKGYKVTGKNGNSIFLPSVGYQDNHGLCDAGYNGYYWSSSLVLDNGENRDAYGFYFDYLGTVDWCLQYYGGIGKSRYCGLSVRPVCP